MKIKVFVPVSDDLSEMIIKMQEYIVPYLRKDTELIFETFKYGFSSIETDLQGMFNGTEVVMHIINDGDNCDGYFVDCFDDPGVYAARELGKKIVIGPYQAAMASALTMGERVGIITTDNAGILSEERKSRLYGVDKRISSIKDIDLGVLNIEKESETVLKRLEEVAVDMISNEGVTVICLGCTAMFGIGDQLSKRLKERNFNVNIVEPFRNGVCYLEYLINQGYTNFITGGVDISSLVWKNN